MKKIVLGTLLAAVLGASAYAAPVTQTGAVNDPGGNLLQLTPTTQFNQACNGGAGGIVGQLGTVSPYLSTVCAPPGSSGGTVTANQGTPATQTQANAWPVIQPDVGSTGNTLNSATANIAYTVTLAGGEGAVGWTVSGLTASGATLTAEASNDGGTTWNAVNTVQAGTGALSTTVTADGQFRINTAGHSKVRLRVSSTGTGTITIASYAITGGGALVTMSTPLPAGTNVLGATTDTNSTIVSGQAKVATTGTAVQFQSASAALNNGLAICAATGNNVAGATIGGSGVTNTVSGSGNGLILFPGQCVAFNISNANLAYVNGTIGDIISYLGN